VLLTGFESYGARSLNPAERVIERLAAAKSESALPSIALRRRPADGRRRLL
jgi:pyrrolidone-carboxylate peptidase